MEQMEQTGIHDGQVALAALAAPEQESTRRERVSLTPAEHAERAYQQKLASFAPGSPPFNALKRSRRSMRVFRHHAMYWPTGRALTENGNGRARR